MLVLLPIAYCTGKFYKLKPSAIFKIDGASFACPINYSIDRLRCTLCGEVQKPTHDIPEGKYTDKFTSQLILHKDFLALPMYRLDGYQKILVVPLLNSTQWDIIYDAYQSFIPIFNELEQTAACA